MSRHAQLLEKSFYDATARERAKGLLDEGSFTEFLGPEIRFSSPHLRALGEAVEFDDGMVSGIGTIAGRPAFVLSQEGQFVGGAVGEVGGAKMVGVLRLAKQSYDVLAAKKPPGWEKGVPAVVISFETGGVRLHEANAGLLAHAEVMDALQDLRGQVPVVAVIGSKVGCFGGMGFVAAACDAVIMSDRGRLGLTGPEVIEQEMGKGQFDSSDRALVYRTTGGKHKYILGDCAYLVPDAIGEFADCLQRLLVLPYEDIAALRVIGTAPLVQEQLALVAEVLGIAPADAKDVWAHYGNTDPDELVDMTAQQFAAAAKRRPGAKGGA